MSLRTLTHFFLTLILFLGIACPPSSQVSGFSKDGMLANSIQADPPEKIVPTEPGLEKLAPNLRKLAQGKGGIFPGADMAGAAQKPLLVSTLLRPGTNVERFFQKSIRSREVAGMQWVTGQIQAAQLAKLASVPDVVSVISTDTYQTADAPGLDDLRQPYSRLDPRKVRDLMTKGDARGLYQYAQQLKALPSDRYPQNQPPITSQPGGSQSAANTPSILDIHDVRTARSQGYTGKSVVVGLVDTGVDFANPDLQGTQALISSGPYAGWPFAYDSISAALYSLDPADTLGPDRVTDLLGVTQYVHTFPVKGNTCNQQTCTAKLNILYDSHSGLEITFTWPNTSKSGKYRYSVLPDYTLAFAVYLMGRNYAEGWLIQPPVIVSDEHEAGVYDTIYTDINYNYHLGDPGEKMTREQPVGGVDLNEDGVWDLSGGMLAWISDGKNQPPGVTTVYPGVEKYPIPGNGELLAFINDELGHGTNCASLIAGQGKIMDPLGKGPVNPLYAGGEKIGGVGGAVVQSIAPDAKIAAIENGFSLPFDSWTLVTLGFDGAANSGDEANIISNSWGDGATIADGWDPLSRFAQQISYQNAQSPVFLVAAGNGGHGYGTVGVPGGGPIVNVGASTAYGNTRVFEYVKPDQFLYGEIQPWSNRGPGALGDIAPDVVAVGAWGLGANPLNSYGDGESAYNIFGGTSMATPVTAGVTAMLYQAFHDHQQPVRWPNWNDARGILLSTAQDLGYDVLVQGAGNVQASRAVNAANRSAVVISPQQWQAGNYRGKNYAAFPAVIDPGKTSRQDFTVRNPSQAAIPFGLTSSTYKNVHDETFSFAFSPPVPESKYRLPIFLENLNGLIDQYHPDLMRAQVILPYNTFDVNGDYYTANTWAVYFYDWLDRNEDGKLWQDKNRDGMVEDGEIDIDAATGLYEFNRFTYGYPYSTELEASLGKSGLAQRHKGIFLGLGCTLFCGYSTTLTVRVTFYQKSSWNWLNFSPASLTVPSNGSASFQASLSAPKGTKPGAYEGGIQLNWKENGKDYETVLPVLANVAATSTSFSFGGTESLVSPFDNSHLNGGFNWQGYPESGDWRFFYFNLPKGSTSLGKAMLVDTRWSDPRTDVDTWLFSSSPGTLDPQYFGPQDLKMIGGSVNTWVTTGKYFWQTSTGYSREIVGASPTDGLGMIALHNVLTGGTQFAETMSGTAYQVSSDPDRVDMIGTPSGALPEPFISGSQLIKLTSTADIKEGLTAQAFGMSKLVNLTDQTAIQNEDYDICLGNWIYKLNQGGLTISHGGVLEITTSASDPKLDSVLDLDIYLARDDGDGVFDCTTDHVVAGSYSALANEKIKIYYPYDGTYWIIVHGQYVPTGKQNFNIQIRAIQGTGLNLRNVPVGPVTANQPIEMTASFNTPYPADADHGLDGVILIGPSVDPSLIEVPVHVRPSILLYPQPDFFAGSRWVNRLPVPFTLAFQNMGVYTENVHAKIQIPEGLVYQAGSASAPGSPPVYDPATRTLKWQGPVNGGTKVNIVFQAAGQPGFAPAQVELQAQVSGEASQQNWPVKTSVWVNRYGLLFPLLFGK